MSISHPHSDELLDSGGTGQRIVRIEADRREAAIAHLVARSGPPDREHARRFIGYAVDNGLPLDQLWAYETADTGAITAAALVLPSPGRTAMVFASRPQGRTDSDRIGRLLDHACEAAARTGDIDLAQVLLEPSERLENAAFIAGGFRKLGSLSYMRRSLRQLPDPPEWPPGVTVTRADAHPPAVLAATLEATYQDTLDCPGLFGLRRTEDILLGHRSTGAYDPALWTVLCVDDTPAGVLFLNPSPAQRTVELVYIGVAPMARGRRLGGRLLTYGLASLRGRSETSISLAVDDSNAPALALYRADGFRRIGRRIALIRPLRDASG